MEKDVLEMLVLIEKDEGGHAVRVLQSPAGRGLHPLTLPFTGTENKEILMRMAADGIEDKLAAVKKIGAQLFQAVFGGEVQTCLRLSREGAQLAGKDLRLRLSIRDDPQLAGLPWEFLFDPELDRFLALENSVNRCIQFPEVVAPLTIHLPIKVLVVISVLKDDPSLDADWHWNHLRQSLADLEQSGRIELHRLPVASPSALQSALEDDLYHVVHFIGRGSYNETIQDGVLWMEDAGKANLSLSGHSLGMMLSDTFTVRLVVLTACEGGCAEDHAGGDGPFEAVARSILTRGIPAVIATQAKVPDFVNGILTRQFYAALAGGMDVDGALTAARRAAYQAGGLLEWSAPVLYTRFRQGQLFNLTSPQPGVTAHRGASGLAYLVVVRGAQAGREFIVQAGTTLFGRDEGNTIPDAQVSRRHAQIRSQEDGFYLEDLGSTNGSYVNGLRISGPALLQHGDTIRFGETLFTFNIVGEGKKDLFVLGAHLPTPAPGSLNEATVVIPQLKAELDRLKAEQERRNHKGKEKGV